MVLRVQDPLVAGVVRVGGVHLNVRQLRRVAEVSHELVGAEVGSQAHGRQVPHVFEGLKDGLDGSGKSQRLDGGHREGLAVDGGELRGMFVVILEGDLLQARSVERAVIDGAHGGGHPDRVEGD